MSAISRIAVIGAGLMGHGIAQVFAKAGYQVSVFDKFPQSLASLHARIEANLRDLGSDEAEIAATSARVTAVPVLADAVREADYVVEAAQEDLAVKQQIFAEVEAAARPDAILASNTSVIPITDIMRNLTRRERAIGTHWWNPPFLVPLVEVIGTVWTAPDIVTRTIALHNDAGKTAVHVKRDVPGFIGNRLQHALWREAIYLVEEGICDAETVDAVVKASFGRRLPVLGPMENIDLVGLDLTRAIHSTLFPALDNRPTPSPLLDSMMAEGKVGMKTGEGFRKWTPEEMAELRRKVFEQLKNAG
jgi:3-hydroxybutyryl-CoA dehydrogenase